MTAGGNEKSLDIRGNLSTDRGKLLGSGFGESPPANGRGLPPLRNAGKFKGWGRGIHAWKRFFKYTSHEVLIVIIVSKL